MGRKKASKNKAEKVIKEKSTGKLDVKLAEIEKKYGKGTIINLGENYKADVISVSTGILSLNEALGVGGVPRGKIVEIFGAESSGKTSLALNIVKEAQIANVKCAYIDMEHGLDINYAKKIGVNIPNLLISQPDYGEQALDILQSLTESEEVGLVVIDSVASLVPKAELEGEMEDANIGLQARLMSKMCRKLAGIINKTNTCVIFINQTRMKIGVMYGSPETTPGGKALKFYASVRLRLQRIKTLKSGEEILGTKIRVKVVKNKVAPPFQTAEFKIYFDEGISYVGEIISLALKYGIIKKSGAWVSYNKKNIAQGLNKTRLLLKEDKELFKEIETKVLEAMKK